MPATKTAMNTRERFHALMQFQPVDRLPVLEWAGWWRETLERWWTQGLPPDLDRYDICRRFGLDIYHQQGVRTCRKGMPVPRLETGSMDEYLAARDCLYPQPAIDREAWAPDIREQESGECVLWASMEGFFWFPRKLFGIEQHLYAFYDHPEVMHQINTDLADWHLAALDEIFSLCTPDFLVFSEDMSYNHGPMLSKELFDEFMLPYYRRVIPRIHEEGVLAIIDSDGDIGEAAGWFEEAGLDGILPLERQAGVDIAKLRAAHPKMRFIGHFDKMVMDKGEAAMRREFERLLPTARQGGFLIACDHQTPPAVTIEDYQLYVRLFREYGAQV